MARRSNTRWIVIAGLAAATAAVLAFLFWPRPLQVETASVRTGPIAETVADQGMARVRRSYVVSAPVAGRLERLPLEVGDAVVAGSTVVARIRPGVAAFLD
ncbi:MAG TPA: efflux transporter periplasmic adaptor subunit, partial [Caulobacteraceae bacterium]|nr:efflux transporter periplasmic adaptor subunit [Caulobacteraceae bacterium]